ncbi:hypothetical protein J3E68DRAFT_166300 [Trichoderma sp. SZMC 28012]
MLASCLQLPGCCARYGVRALPLIALVPFVYGEVQGTPRSSFRRGSVAAISACFSPPPRTTYEYMYVSSTLSVPRTRQLYFQLCHFSILPQSTNTEKLQDPTEQHQVCLLYHAPVAFSASTQSPALPAPMRSHRRRRFSPFAAPTCPVARADWPRARRSCPLPGPYQVPARPESALRACTNCTKHRQVRMYPVLAALSPPPKGSNRPDESPGFQPQAAICSPNAA